MSFQPSLLSALQPLSPSLAPTCRMQPVLSVQPLSFELLQRRRKGAAARTPAERADVELVDQQPELVHDPGSDVGVRKVRARAPRRHLGRAVRKVRAALAFRVVAVRAVGGGVVVHEHGVARGMVPDDVDRHAHVQVGRRVDKGLEAVRAPQLGAHGVRRARAVAPAVRRPAVVHDGHQLDHRDPQLREVRQLGRGGGQGARGRERADLHLVDDRVGGLDDLARVAPLVRGRHDGELRVLADVQAARVDAVGAVDGEDVGVARPHAGHAGVPVAGSRRIPRHRHGAPAAAERRGQRLDDHAARARRVQPERRGGRRQPRRRGPRRQREQQRGGQPHRHPDPRG